MADLAFVCVREDVRQTEALAAMFAAAGFSIGDAPRKDNEIAGIGAAVIIWSDAAVRSRPFVQSAQLMMDAERAVIVSLVRPAPSYATVGDVRVFDLSRWRGDPDDHALDTLFFAVDHLVKEAQDKAAATHLGAEWTAPLPSGSISFAAEPGAAA